MCSGSRPGRGLALIRHFVPEVWVEPHPGQDEVEVDERLYLDVSNSYGIESIARWEAFVNDVDTYNDACLGSVENISQQIVERSGLASWPKYDGKSPGIDSGRLAIVAWEEQLGQRRQALRLHDAKAHWEIQYENQLVGIGTQQDMRNCLDIVNAVGQEPPGIAIDIGLENQAQSLADELGDLIRSQRLKNKCAFIS